MNMSENTMSNKKRLRTTDGTSKAIETSLCKKLSRLEEEYGRHAMELKSAMEDTTETIDALFVVLCNKEMDEIFYEWKQVNNSMEDAMKDVEKFCKHRDDLYSYAAAVDREITTAILENWSDEEFKRLRRERSNIMYEIDSINERLSDIFKEVGYELHCI